MKAMLRSACVACLFVLSIGFAAAQTTSVGCSTVNFMSTAQTLRCEGGITIVAENGARYTLSDTDHDGRVDLVELSSKAMLRCPNGRAARRFASPRRKPLPRCEARSGRLMPRRTRRRSLSSTATSVLAGGLPPASSASCLDPAKASTSKRAAP